MKRIAASLLCACLMLALLCACGGTKYTFFAYDYDGHVISSDSMTASLTLMENGAGTLVVNGSSGRVTWSEEDGELTVRAGSENFTGTLKDGIAVLDLGDGNIMYFAAEGADTSSLNVMTFEDYILGTLR